MFAIFQNRALSIAVSVLNNCTMARNIEPDTMIKSSDVRGATGGTGSVVGGSIEVAWGIDGVVGMGGIDSMGYSFYCACLGCAGTGHAGLGKGLLQVLTPLDSYLPTVSIGREWNVLDNGGGGQGGAH